VLTVFAALFGALAAADDEPTATLAVNFVPINERLHTAGQPDEMTLASLGSRGYGLIINLAPPAVSPSEEAEILAASGVRYVNIPVDWRNPTVEDFAAFSRALAAAADERVLVHCQMNMRASMFTFLHRVTNDGADPAEAYKAVSAVWTPSGVWAELGSTVLAEHGVDFDFAAGSAR
jgi:protein tyrosine phosphatase (PTP) superfamily phosphohydrolase (DUF442 family)